MNSSTFTFLSCLLFLCAQGMPDSRSRRCKCLNGYIGRVDTKSLKQHLRSEPVIHQPDAFCHQLEIIIIIKGEEKCVDPQSPLGKCFLKNKRKWENKRPVIMTTSSSQSKTLSSTRPHITGSAPTTM